MVLLLYSNLCAQECLIDGKSMYSIGSSEIVNGELLSLFRCDDGHQMWLSNYAEENKVKEIVANIIDTPETEPVLSSATISLLENENEQETIPLVTEDSPVSIPITKKETVLKVGSASANYISDISIKKFGVETLLHKKIESDRVFAENIEDEKNELLYIMNSQKRLFEMVDRKKYKLSPFENLINLSIYSALLLILISSL